MANDSTIRSSVLWLAVILVAVGIWTRSWKKTMVTYALGMFGIGGVLLPDRDFFDRDFSRWPFPVTVEEKAALLAQRSASRRFRIYPMRVIAYTTIYSFALYKWWMFVTN
ncbi:hypothetical protein CFOL_v3_07089 [Cephalotus follicularis]|uniref:Uncharacterized protein n=1 Tax=Cephalotus follicularis TaxID=3775 RepID=A0A1Q3B6B9_CEPFO|nr:hypothetical protein CFOL_v3_07089 [Cephalotus follicularis]